jgi:hypothetical protein
MSDGWRGRSFCVRCMSDSYFFIYIFLWEGRLVWIPVPMHESFNHILLSDFVTQA